MKIVFRRIKIYFRIIKNKNYDINISLLRELHDLVKGKTKNLNIVLYIQRGINNDYFIDKYFKSDKIAEKFTIIRTRDQFNFMLGCLYTNSNKMVYASEYKHSISEELCKLMNPDLENKSKAFKHINIKELMNKRDKSKYLKLLKNSIFDDIELIDQEYTSDPLDSKY